MIKQNVTRDIEKNNKVTVTRGEVGWGNGRKKWKCCQGTCIKSTWTNQNGVTSRVGGGEGWGGMAGGNGDNCT